MGTRTLTIATTLTLIAALTLPACADKETGGKDTSDTDTDTDSGDTDSGDTDSGDTDSGDTDTSDTGGGGGTTITFDMDGPYEGKTITLNYLDATTIGTTSYTFGASLTHTIAAADPQEMSVGQPLEDAFVAFNEETAPGLEIALYVPALHQDTDSDSVLSGEEVWLGVSTTWLGYVRGTIPEALATRGLVAGWNSFRVGASLTEAAFGPVTAVPLSANLLTKTVAELSGTYSGSTGRLAALPYAVTTGTEVAALLADDDLASTWTIMLDGEPDADHFTGYPGLGYAAWELPVSYKDRDSSDDYSDGDTIEYYACSEGSVVIIGYAKPTAMLSTALSMVQRGQTPGWTPFALGETGATILTPDLLGSLELSDACSL